MRDQKRDAIMAKCLSSRQFVTVFVSMKLSFVISSNHLTLTGDHDGYRIGMFQSIGRNDVTLMSIVSTNRQSGWKTGQHSRD